MRTLVPILYVLVGLINFAPIIGALSGARLESLYSIELTDPNLVIAMRHRAILLAIVGALLIHAAFVPSARTIAATAGAISMLTYIALVGTSAVANPSLTRVMWVDVFATFALLAAVAADHFSHRAP